MATYAQASTVYTGRDNTITFTGEITGGGSISLNYTFGGLTGTLVTNKRNLDPITWRPPDTFYAEMGDLVQMKGTFEVYYTSTAGRTSLNSTSTFYVRIDEKPALTAAVIVADVKTKTLTGNSTSIIPFFSKVKVTTTAAPTTGATLKSYSLQIGPMKFGLDASAGSYTSTGDSYNYGDYIFRCEDSRGLTNGIKKTLTVIPYTTPTVTVDDISITSAGVATVQLSGTWAAINFGAGNNRITVRFRYKVSSESTYTSWTDISTSDVTANSDGTFTATATTSGLNYLNAYDFQGQVQDLVTTVEGQPQTGKSIPIFDWSESDFNFNVPVTVPEPTEAANPVTKKYAEDNFITKTYATNNLATKSYAKSQRPSVNGTKSEVKILMGTETMQFSNNSTGTNKTITFSTPFTSRPMVIAGQTFNSANVLVFSKDVSTTGFTLTIAPVGSKGTRDVDWIAIGV